MNKKTSSTIAVSGLAVLIVLNVISGSLAENGAPGSEILQSVGLIGGAAYVIGLCLLARAKGRNWAWGLTGLICVIGGITVPLLKERLR